MNDVSITKLEYTPTLIHVNIRIWSFLGSEYTVRHERGTSRIEQDLEGKRNPTGCTRSHGDLPRGP